MNLISFGAVETYKDLTVAIDTLTFKNMNFTQSSNLISFQSQMSNQMIIGNFTVNNITNGQIFLHAVNLLSIDLPAKRKIQNLTANDLCDEYSSFILINEGAELEITGSFFTNIYWYKEGTIMFVGYQNSMMSIYDSTFTINTTIKVSVLAYIIKTNNQKPDNNLKWKRVF